jgi:hypothetical protein
MVADYYAMLGVEPGADRAAVEAALARQQPIWSSGTRNPKNKHTYQSYLDQIPAIRQALLGDPAARAAYDAELAAAGRAERDRKLDELQRLVRLRAAKGGLTVADRDLLREQAAKLGLTAADLDRLAEPIPPKPEAPADDDTPDPPADVLDPTTRRQIRVALEHLRRRDLYDALGLPRDAPTDEIAARADAERRRWMQKAQVTAEKTAWLEVVSHAQSHLASPPARARYDRTLVLEAEEALIASIEFALKGISRLDPGTRAALVDEAAARGIAPDRADRLIGRACRALGVARDAGAIAPASGGAPRLLRCRSCAGVTEYAAAARSKGAECRHCGGPLRWACPLCKATHWVDEPRCACGFRLELLGPLTMHFEAAQVAFRARDLRPALAHLERVRDIAPQHVGARKGIEKVHERLVALERAQADLESARAAGKLVSARKMAEAWGRLAPPGDPAWKAAWSDVVTALGKARDLAGRARALEATDPSAARDLYRRALAIAADLPEALAGIKRCPPDPPPSLSGEYEGGVVQLRWTPPAPDGLGPLSFVIVRKVGAALEHPGDGTRIAETSAAEYEDRNVAPGGAVAYAVLSRRGDVESVAATAVGPIWLLADVSDVRVSAKHHAVDLSWAAPPGAHEVRVVRRRGAAPSGPKDGDRVEAMRDRAHDDGLEDDRVYHYGIFAIYRLPDGRLVPSRGVFVTAQPHAPAPVPSAPAVTTEPDGRVRLTWAEPSRGAIRILRTAKALPMAPGDRLSAAAAGSIEGRWLEGAGPGTAIDPAPPPLGACHYTPMLDWAGTLTVGHGVGYSCVPDPSELRATRVGSGGRVHLRWRWSPRGAQSLIVARSGSPPRGPDDPEAVRTVVHEGEYSRRGYTTLVLPTGGPGPWHIRVYSVATADGAEVVSPGLEPSAETAVPGPNPEVTVSYAFRRPGFAGRSWSLIFRTDPPGSEIPPTALVAHPRTVPLSADDGEIVGRFPAALDGATFPVPPGLDLSRTRARVFADPHAEPDSLPPIRLRHPETDAARA